MLSHTVITGNVSLVFKKENILIVPVLLFEKNLKKKVLFTLFLKCFYMSASHLKTFLCFFFF